jgi:hypothetical protein
LNRIDFEFSTGLVLSYQLRDTKTAEQWLQMMAQMTPRMMASNTYNHRHGFASQADIRSAIALLSANCNILQLKLPALSANHWQNTLNALHVNFPEFERKLQTRQEFHAAHKMNLLIHWLEYELSNHLGRKGQYLFNLDFNHDPRAYNLKKPFAKAEMTCFSPHLGFGNLHLHYINIGRHFLEMYDAQDRVCPKHHFRPQHEFNATCGLSFSEPLDDSALRLGMLRYYQMRGGQDYFGYSFYDPALAVGFFRLGTLMEVDSYQTFERRAELREKLQSAVVMGWQIH